VHVDVITDVGDDAELANMQPIPWKFIEMSTSLGSTYKSTEEPVISAFRKTLVAGEIGFSDYRTDMMEIDGSHFADWFADTADTIVFGHPAVGYILQNEDMALTPEELQVNVFERKAYYSVTENAAREKRRINAFRKFISMYDGPEYRLRDKIKEKNAAHLSAKGLKAAAGYMLGILPSQDYLGSTPYTDMFDRFYLHRHFFITKNGYMGTGPWTIAKGDIVMLVAGAAVPYIFRKGVDECWELVGEAYCHGVMGGEEVVSIREEVRRPVPGIDLTTVNFVPITVV
jgi:hypothetical protein